MKLWQKIVAALAAVAAVALLVVKFILGKREQKSKDGVTTALETQRADTVKDTVDAAGAVGVAKGEENAAVKEVTAIVETTEPATEERVDALAESLKGMRRGQ